MFNIKYVENEIYFNIKFLFFLKKIKLFVNAQVCNFL